MLCNEQLAHCIEKAVEGNVWKQIKLVKNGVPISHLLFANDFFLFTKASLEQVEVINFFLDSFLQ